MKKSPTVVSVINLKGGVGKTTVTTLLARHAANLGLDVLAVDMDPQANLSQALMTEDEYQNLMDEKKLSIVELFNGFASPSVNTPGPSPLKWGDVIQVAETGRHRISDSESGEDVPVTLDVIPSRFDFSDNLIASTGQDHKVLAKFISAHMQHKDLVLIDCAPTESILTRISYKASRYVLIPVKTEFFSTIGFPLMVKSLDDFRTRNCGHQIDVCGVLVHNTKTSGGLTLLSDVLKYHQGTKDGFDSLVDIRKQSKANGWHLFDHVMNHSDAYPRWANDPNAPRLHNAGDEWPAIADEILAKIGLSKPAGASS